MTRLFRSRTDRKVTGLCGGLSETLNIDSTLLRVIVIVTAFFSGGVIIPIYFLASIVIPSEPFTGGPYGGYGPEGRGYGKWGGGWGAWAQNGGSGRHGGRGGRRHYDEPHYSAGPQHNDYQSARPQQEESKLDDMMKDIEKKAMWKEIEELRARVAQYEKQQSKPNGGSDDQK